MTLNMPPAPPQADVTAIVVNYGTADLALQAVESLLAHPERLARVHLVDNASPGGDGMRLAAEIARRGWADRVSLHAETVNHGFGRGNNLVIAPLLAQPAESRTGGKVFLLNPDARVEGQAVAVLADFLDSHPRAGAVGARIEKPAAEGEPLPVTAAFRFPSLISVFSDAVNFGPVTRLCARWQVPMSPDLGTARVDWVSGAAVMFRTEALAEVGGFDPGFFLYHEEVELMHRLAGAGWQTWRVAEALAYHAEGVSTGVRSGEPVRRRRPAYWYDSWQHYMRLTHGRGAALVAAGLWLSGAALHHAISALRGHRPSTPLHVFRDIWTHAFVPLLMGKRGRNA